MVLYLKIIVLIPCFNNSFQLGASSTTANKMILSSGLFFSIVWIFRNFWTSWSDQPWHQPQIFVHNSKLKPKHWLEIFNRGKIYSFLISDFTMLRIKLNLESSIPIPTYKMSFGPQAKALLALKSDWIFPDYTYLGD